MYQYTAQFVARFWSKVLVTDNADDCWLWIGNCDTKGYGRIGLNYKTIKAHRVSYQIANGSLADNLEVLHSCDNPPCVNPRHLSVGTQQDNMKDRERKGRANHATGEKHGRHKLTDAQISEIRRLYAETDTTQRALALQFDICHRHVVNILQRKNRK